MMIMPNKNEFGVKIGRTQKTLNQERNSNAEKTQNFVARTYMYDDVMQSKFCAKCPSLWTPFDDS